MNKKNTFIAFFITISLIFFSALGYALFKPKANKPETINTMADISLPVLNQTPDKGNIKNANISLRNLPNDYTLINVWGSWCISCIKEHPFLMSLKGKISILGINWYDDPDKANQFLTQYGNPFYQILVDDDGVFSVAMGVKGAPESFLVKKNTVIAQHRGILTREVWQKKFAPHLKNLDIKTVKPDD